LFDLLVTALPWRSDRRVMYERLVDVPRLTASLAVDDPSLPPLVTDMAVSLSSHYCEHFDRLGANLYRHGSDSVAWHADRVGRVQIDPLVAIVSVGGPRRLALRPKGGGSSIGFDMRSGDLLVMGGACQHRWEHRVPKVAASPPRISLTFRHGLGPPT
jgi:alkylated DNA repair dioxygenase AlkB